MVSIFDTLKQWFSRSPEHSTFKALGNGYWFASYTNNFIDLDGEILAEKAHDEFIARLDLKLVPMPELWAWHTPGTKHGQADTVWREGHMICALGHFEPGVRESAEAYYTKNKVQLSHGFTYPEWALKDGVYESYNTFEISTLPLGKAANPYTEFVSLEELKAMALTDEKKDFIKSILTDASIFEQVEALNNSVKNKSELLDGLGVAHKDATEVTEPETEPTEEKQVVDVDLLEDVLTGQAEALNAADKALKQTGDVITTLVEQAKQDKAAIEKLVAAQETHAKELAALQAKIGQAPRRASEDDATIVESEAAQKAVEETQNVEYDPLFPGMKVQKVEEA